MQPQTEPWPKMRSRVRVVDRPFGWGYLGAAVLLSIGIAAVVNAERHEQEHRARTRR